MSTSEDSIKNCPTNQQTKQIKKKSNPTKPKQNIKQTTVPISESNNHNYTTDHLLICSDLPRLLVSLMVFGSPFHVNVSQVGPHGTVVVVPADFFFDFFLA